MLDLYDRNSLIFSILDNDLYKFTMQQAVLELFPEAVVEYRFKNRGSHRFPPDFATKLKAEIQKMAFISLTDTEFNFISRIPFFKPWYRAYLRNYRFDPNEVQCHVDDNGQLHLDIAGPWHSTILWEVPLMALISELYFTEVDTNWDPNPDNVRKTASEKCYRLSMAGCHTAEFGTRRRKSFDVQFQVVKGFRGGVIDQHVNTFIGTSNVLMAMLFDLKVIGTMAHEWIMAMSVLEGLRNANYYALQNWVRVYNANLGIALTDTFGLDSFLRNFNLRLTKLYDGVRHDSGCPHEFTNRMIEHYYKANIQTKSKAIVYSDGLDVDEAVRIHGFYGDKVRDSYGMGTHLTNDFEGSPALNMVIKLWTCMGVPVVKLPDTDGKIMGDPDAIRVAKWVHRGEPLD